MCTWLQPLVAQVSSKHPCPSSHVCCAAQDLPEGAKPHVSINNAHALPWSVQLCSLKREVVWGWAPFAPLSAWVPFNNRFNFDSGTLVSECHEAEWLTLLLNPHFLSPPPFQNTKVFFGPRPSLQKNKITIANTNTKDNFLTTNKRQIRWLRIFSLGSWLQIWRLVVTTWHFSAMPI